MPYLCSSDNIRLGLNRPRSQKYLPVGSPSGHGERRREGDDVGTEASQGETNLWEAQLEGVRWQP